MNGQPHVATTTIAFYVVIAALLLWRYSRPQRMTITRMWVGPTVLAAMTALVIWSSQRIFPAPPLAIALALILGVLLGVPLGFLRGKHTGVRATEVPGVMYLDASWIVMALWIGAFVIRAGLRYVFPLGTSASLMGDGIIAFALSAVVVSYYVIFRKYRELEVQAGQL